MINELGLWPPLRSVISLQTPRTLPLSLGKADVAGRAFARFARAYADQTEADHEALQQAVKAGRLRVSPAETDAEDVLHDGLKFARKKLFHQLVALGETI